MSRCIHDINTCPSYMTVHSHVLYHEPVERTGLVQYVEKLDEAIDTAPVPAAGWLSINTAALLELTHMLHPI